MKIKVIKFGPIENAEIDFAPMMVFTGDSNLGKSYINYLMYYVVYSITNIDVLEKFIAQKRKEKNEFEIAIKSIEGWLESRVEPFMATFLNSPDIQCSVKFELTPSNPDKVYQCKISQTDVSIVPTEKKEDITILKLTKYVIDIDGKQNIFNLADLADADFIITYCFTKTLQSDIINQEIKSVFILPPARGAFVGENYTLKDKISSSVGMYRMFLNDYDKATSPMFSYSYLSKRRKTAQKYSTEIGRLLNGKLSSRNGKQYLELKNGQKIPLSASASSIKELSPFLFALQNDPETQRSFCIEEPEAHLHPQMQINVTDLIASCFSDGMMFQFTTHSDYVLQRINQLIKLSYIKNHDKEKFTAICERHNFNKRHCINPDKIKMYYFAVNEEGKVTIEQLNVTEKGVPMVTFFEVVRSISEVEDDLENAIDEINESQSNENK